MINRKGNIFIISLIALLLLAVSAAGYLLIQNRQLQNQAIKPVPPIQNFAPVLTSPPAPTLVVDPTANWKTYTNSGFGFSFEYPDAYFKYSKTIPNIGVYLAPTEGTGEAKGTPMGLGPNDLWLNATVLSGANLSSIEEYMNVSPGVKERFDRATKEQILIDGNKAYKVTLQTAFPQSTAELIGLTLKNSNIYQVSLSAQSLNILKAKAEWFDQILSTFKFL